MKKIIFALAILVALCFAGTAFGAAAGTVTNSGILKKTTGEVVLVYTCTASVDAATYPATAIAGAALAAIANTPWLVGIETVPSGTATPTDLFDVTLTNANSIDLLGGAGMNRSNTTAQRTWPLVATGFYGPAFVYGTTTINISGNAVNSAIITLRLIFSK